MRRLLNLGVWCLVGAMGSSAWGIPALREFHSSLPLRVYERGSADENDRLLGIVGGATTVSVPADGGWYVAPLSPLTEKNWAALLAEFRHQHIPGLDITGRSEVNDRLLAALRELPDLRLLLLARTSVSDAGLAVLKAMSQLTVLALGEKITDKGIAALRPLKRLKDLDLSDSAVTAKGLASCPRLPQLERLILSNTPLGKTAMASLNRFPHLHYLMLGGPVGSDESQALSHLAGLQELDVSQAQVAEDAIRWLARIPALTTLYLNPEIGDAGVAALTGAKHLRRLDLTGTRVTSLAMQSLATMPRLEELALGQTAVTGEGIAALQKLPHLRALEVSETGVKSGDLATIRGFPALQMLSLSWTPTTTADRQAIGEWPALRLVIVNGKPLAAAGLALRPLPNRPVLAMHRKPISTLPRDLPSSMDVLSAAPAPAGALPRPSGSLPMLVSRAQKNAPLAGFNRNPSGMPGLPLNVLAAPGAAPLETGQTHSWQTSPQLANARTTPLSGLRRLHELERDPASLSDITPDTSQTHIPSMDPKAENTVGDFTMGVEPAHRRH